MGFIVVECERNFNEIRASSSMTASEREVDGEKLLVIGKQLGVQTRMDAFGYDFDSIRQGVWEG